MSWGEISRINSNMKKTLNEQLREHSFTILKVITETGTYTPEKTGLYRGICVGAGGNGVNSSSTSTYLSIGGGGGGVAIKDMVLSSTTSYNVTVSTYAQFGAELIANGGTTGGYSGSSVTTEPVGGTASGGDYNFQGERGWVRSKTNLPARGGSVQCVIPGLNKDIFVADAMYNKLRYGNSILGYGGGGPAVIGYLDGSYNRDYHLSGLPAAVIIIPLELEGY